VSQAEIGIIGGSGLYSMPGFTNVHEERVETPFGEPSDPFVLGELEGRKVAFLARHGRGHRILPSELNFRANIYAFKKLGVERIVSVSAVGSLKEEHKPTEFVIPDQFIDRTFHRVSTFFGDGIVGHVAFGDPVCSTVAKAAADACASAGVVGKLGGTYVCMEGPQFSTRAESNLYRSWGADVIGMTNLQEAKLAREAEICYATVAMVTDYDSWREGHGRDGDAPRAGLRVCFGGEICRADATGCDSRGGQRETRAALRKISWLVRPSEERNPRSIRSSNLFCNRSRLQSRRERTRDTMGFNRCMKLEDAPNGE
jgi:5'-methylthioadenosine phosphorylase